MAVIQSSSEAMSTLTSAVGFTTLPSRTQAARISVTGAGRIRYRDDGGTPTASVGHPITQYQYFWIIGRQQLENFRVIEEATSALYVTYFDNVNDVG